MQHIGLLFSILILTWVFCLALQTTCGRKQSESKYIAIKLIVEIHLMVSKHHQLDRYDNTGIWTSLDTFWKELKNENHKDSFLNRNHNGK